MIRMGKYNCPIWVKSLSVVFGKHMLKHLIEIFFDIYPAGYVVPQPPFEAFASGFKMDVPFIISMFLPHYMYLHFLVPPTVFIYILNMTDCQIQSY